MYMPVHLAVDSEHQVVFVIHLGLVDDVEVLALNERIRLDPRVKPGFSIFVDLRETRSELRTTVALKHLAEKSKQWLTDPASSSRIAILAPRDISYGLARMFGAFSNAAENQFGVFRDLHAATDWPGIPVSSLEKARSSIE